MHFVFTTLGSFGDVLPMVAMGSALRERGHDVVFVTNPYHERLVTQAGLRYRPLGNEDDYQRLVNNRNMWDRRRGLKILAKASGAAIRPLYSILAEESRRGTIVVASGLMFGARLAHEKLGMPLATVHLQPAMFRSIFHPPMVPGLALGHWMPPIINRITYWTIDHYLDRLFLPELQDLRCELGLPRIHRIFEWFNSPQLVIGMFPSWYADPQDDWPRNTVLAGFPLLTPETPVMEDLESFLKEGGIPVVGFTYGSAMAHGRDFYTAAVQACTDLGIRGLLLTRYPAQLPDKLPSEVRRYEHVSLSWLAPYLRALVHHGGIGTTAHALAAGIPQLIVPAGFDQFDNARRLRKLGCGNSLPRASLKGEVMARELQALWSTATINKAASEWAAKVRGESHLTYVRACVALESLAV